MFEPDRTATFEMRSPAGASNPTHNPRSGSFLVFDPIAPATPPVRLLDRTCDDLDATPPLYGTLVQGYRLLTCTGEITRKDGISSA